MGSRICQGEPRAGGLIPPDIRGDQPRGSRSSRWKPQKLRYLRGRANPADKLGRFQGYYICLKTKGVSICGSPAAARFSASDLFQRIVKSANVEHEDAEDEEDDEGRHQAPDAPGQRGRQR